MTDAKGCVKGLRRAAVLFAAIGLLAAAVAAESQERQTDSQITAESVVFPVVFLGYGELAQIAEVLDGRTLRLTDGRLVRLAGLHVPEPRRRRMSVDHTPSGLSEQARIRLAALAAGRTVTLHMTDPTPDRYGRLVAHMVRQDGLWLQETLIAEGAAIVLPLPDAHHGLLAALMGVESRARAAGVGLWGDRRFGVRTAETAGTAVSGYGLVEGSVRSVAEVRGRVYLNFGADWRTDFTVTVAPSHRRSFEQHGIVWTELAGVRIRARGWIRDFNGPLIDASHPAQIELLGPEEPSSDAG